MNLESFFNPVDLDSPICNCDYIKSYMSSFPELDSCKIVMFGIQQYEANKIRNYLYQMEEFTNEIIDLGNVKSKEPKDLQELIQLLEAKGIFVLILAPENTTYIHSSSLAHQNISFVEPSMKFLANNLMPSKRVNVLAYQKHLYKSSSTEANSHISGLRLGALRNRFSDIEPYLRDSDSLLFNIDAIKYAEIPGNEGSFPSGLTSEEACQIARYAGISDRLKTFAVHGYDGRKDIDDQAAKTLAQMYWYFLEGWFNRKHDYPIKKSDLQEFMIDLNHTDLSLSFYKSKSSGRWWIELPNHDELISCSYNEYVMTCNDEIPERIVNLID